MKFIKNFKKSIDKFKNICYNDNVMRDKRETCKNSELDLIQHTLC